MCFLFFIFWFSKKYQALILKAHKINDTIGNGCYLNQAVFIHSLMSSSSTERYLGKSSRSNKLRDIAIWLKVEDLNKLVSDTSKSIQAANHLFQITQLFELNEMWKLSNNPIPSQSCFSISISQVSFDK